METQHLCVPTFLASIAAHFGVFHCCFRSLCSALFSFRFGNNLDDYQIFPFSTRPATTTTTMSSDTDADTDTFLDAGRDTGAGGGTGTGTGSVAAQESDNNDAFVLFYFCVYVCTCICMHGHIRHGFIGMPYKHYDTHSNTRTRSQTSAHTFTRQHTRTSLFFMYPSRTMILLLLLLLAWIQLLNSRCFFVFFVVVVEAVLFSMWHNVSNQMQRQANTCILATGFTYWN